jgi:hypothetical protein
MRPDITDPGISWWRRIGWFVAIWTGSVVALGTVAYGIRTLIR